MVESRGGDYPSAFPYSYWATPHSDAPSFTTGMTLRDWFARHAFSQGMATLVASDHNLNDYQLGALAKIAYLAADAMLAARGRTGG